MTTGPAMPRFCANHPQRETGLLCNRCEKPICPQCAVLTPTGYRCKECIRGQQKAFVTAAWYDYPLAFMTAGIMSYLGSLVTGLIGFFTLLLAPLVGVAVAETVRFVVRKRRAPRLNYAALMGTLLGSGISLLPFAALLLAGRFTGGASFLLSLAIRGIYVVLVTSSMFSRLTGTQLKI